MTGDITIKNQDLINAIEETSLGEIIKPLVNEIHLFDTFVAGTTYLDDDSVLDEIAAGDKLRLRREDNKFDEKAILVLDAQNRKLGYIPRKDNVVFSRLIDAGKLLMAKITDIDMVEAFTRIRIGIYLVDY
ncbi:MAG: HIRAN domain-containing protein [Firmicutes bacterium]|nr:HIRAN domain-containing protein [Bacillota bacterium]